MNWFAKALKESKYNCTSLSRETGITVRRIKAVRDGNTQFTPVGIKKICSVLGIDPPKYRSTGVRMACSRSSGCKEMRIEKI